MRCDHKPGPCPRCGDRFVHLFNRGQHESSSAFGQHIHDTYPVDFCWADIDGLIYKQESGILRVIEHKPRGGTLTPCQRSVLPLLAVCVDYLIDGGEVDGDSGVFLVNSDPPFDSALVRRYRRYDDGKWSPGFPSEGVEMLGVDFDDFKTGRSTTRHRLSGSEEAA